MAFQLFPPPQKKPKRQLGLNRPARPSSPEPAVELSERAKSPVDFHELLIQVNSETVSEVTVPSRAHVNNPSCSPLEPVSTNSASKRSAPPTRDLPPPPLRSPRRDDRATPPQFPSRTIARAESPGPSTRPSTSKKYPECRASPVSSEMQSLRLGSPTLVRSNSGATCRSQTSPREEPIMRSIFPRYDPNLPLSQQPYQPTQASPTHIPREKISKQPYSPEFYIPHSNLAADRPTTVYYTPEMELEHLWHAANGRQTIVAARTYSLQLHSRPSQSAGSGKSSTSGRAEMAIGPSYARPLYSFTQSTCLPSAGTKQCQTSRHELLIQRHHPSNPQSPAIVVAQLSLTTPPPNHAVVKEEEANNGISHDDAILVTTIHPKATTTAPSPTSPSFTSPTSQSIKPAITPPCSLVYLPSTPHPTTTTSTPSSLYELRHPTLGTFPIHVSGNLRPTPPSSSSSTPTSSSTKSKTQPPRLGSITLLPPRPARPSSPSPPQHQPTTEPLARLDLATASMTLDGAALMGLADSNACMVDVAAVTLLAVVVAEGKRAGERKGTVVVGEAETSGLMFEGPPEVGRGKGRGKGKKAEWEQQHKRWWGVKGKGVGEGDVETGLKTWKSEEVRLPWVTEVILAVLGCGFRVLVAVLGVCVKVVAGVVVGISRCVVKG
ncbi:hypothetical protein K490DRAFT_68222 [Saccharata proteae CBS 121410]|uniref:Uncharacterized protein n=1 Tax=Saccharata proteae CBS 121410 TaxID=1314787 RepID=A0A9P4LUM1_9PEZI|nr:hypothetical protein K490DRAFT_68222 [Saccharata proteae CBS 121410]